MPSFNTGSPVNFYTAADVDDLCSSAPNGGGHTHDSDHIDTFYDKVRFYACKADTTANRPSGGSINAGHIMFDTTLGLPIWWTGSAWVDATGATV